MRAEILEELAPVCPRCLHGEGRESPLVMAEVFETRGGAVWHGMLHCSESACWREYPVIDGVPVLAPDPVAYIAGTRHQILLRDDLPPMLESAIGDACGPGGEIDATRQHLSLYARSHFADLIEPGAPRPCIAGALAHGLDALGAVQAGPAVDLGGSVGRGGWEIAARHDGPVLVGDLNFAMLRLGQRLALEGEAGFERRRIGLVYDRATIRLTGAMAGARIDFWLVDAMQLPFRTGTFALATAINLIDCVPGPTNVLVEMARVLRPGGGAVVATPYDWSAGATEPTAWMGGHSQRGPLGGAAEPVLRATMLHHGLEPVAEAGDLPWRLTLHERAVMEYSLHLIAARRAGGAA